ncbi:hypothetical protein V2J09_003174 [Rumex salicifolius]
MTLLPSIIVVWLKFYRCLRCDAETDPREGSPSLSPLSSLVPLPWFDFKHIASILARRRCFSIEISSFSCEGWWKQKRGEIGGIERGKGNEHEPAGGASGGSVAAHERR